MAFALAVLPSRGNAPGSPAIQCIFNTAAVPTIRAEGLAELVGDIVLNCIGGTPAALGAPVPQADITIHLNPDVIHQTNATVTSRVTVNPFTEVLMLIDEPHSPSNPAIPLVQCDPNNANLGVCAITGTGNGVGTYNGTGGRPNVFQARADLMNPYRNSVTFYGVPIDPPGPSGNRIIRITNLRVNPNPFNPAAPSGWLVPAPITAFISVSPQNLLPISNPQQTVAFVVRSFAFSVQNGSMTAPANFPQCIDANKGLAGDPNQSLGTGSQDGQQFVLRFDEGFPSAWKEKNIATHLANTPTRDSNGHIVSFPTVYPPDSPQDVPGANYFSESGLEVNGTTIGAAPPGYGPFLAPNAAFVSAGRGADLAGTADHGTRFLIAFNQVPKGTQLYLPATVNLTIPANSNVVSGLAVACSSSDTGGGKFVRPGFSPDNGLFRPSQFGPAVIACYEVLYADPFSLERMEVPVAVAYAANPGNNLPDPLAQSSVTGGYGPVSSFGSWDTNNLSPIPRFLGSDATKPGYRIARCTCSLLFPWVVYTQGYDTGIAISNTSVDSFGTTPQQGTVTINYYNDGTPPPPQTTDAPVPGGQTLVFTLSGGGTFGIGPINGGFSGYIIAQAQFQYCHGYSYIGNAGALPGAPGTSAGYLGLVLDTSGLSRTGQTGEVLIH